MSGALPAFDRRPPSDPHAAARTILSEPRFRIRAAHAHESWTAWVLHWLADRWRDFARALAQHVRIGRGASIAIGDVMLVGAVLLVIAIAVLLLRQYVKDAAAPSAAAHPLERRLRAEQIYAQSAQAAEREEYAHAVALLFAAALAALGVRGIVADDPSRTVNECRRDVRAAAPHSAAAFDAIAAMFSAVVYADAPASRTDWERACQAYAQLLAGAPRAA